MMKADPSVLARLANLELEAGELIARHEQGRDPREFHKYQGDPVAFMKAELAFDPWSKQAEVAESVLRNKRTHVRGCHGAGKDAVLAALILWACYARDMLVVVVSATERQLIGQLWTEMARHATRRGDVFPGDLRNGWVAIDGERRINAMTSGSTSNLTGWHNHRGTGTFVAISESQAEQVGAAAFDAAAGNTASAGSRICVVGNPTEPSGRFYETHRLPTWNAIRISAFDHPNIIEGRSVIPGGPDPDWPADMAAEQGGTESSFYISRVLGEFPTEASDAAIPAEAIEAALDRYRTNALSGRAAGAAYTLGIDPAGPGEDAFAVTVWRGPIAETYHTWRRLEAPESADRIIEIVRALRRDPMATFGGSQVRGLYIDEIGIGHGVAGILKRKFSDSFEWHGVAVEGVNVSKKPGDPERFVRRKDELIWALREDLVEGRIAIAPNDKLVEELKELRIRQTPDGKVETEPKEQMRARLGRSPDHLDSLLIGMSPRVPDGRYRVLIG